MIYAVFLFQLFILAVLARIFSKLQTLETKMSQLDDQIQALQTEVTNDTTVIGSAITLIQGFNQRLADAIAAALAAGATQTQLQALTDLKTTLTANDQALADAVAAGTPQAKP
jgi:predicted  nucleic acid-binding Zn-ribbon protein